MSLVRPRAEVLPHVHQTNSQYNLPDLGKKIAYTANRNGVATRFPDPAVQQSGEGDLALLGDEAPLRSDLELHSIKAAKPHDAQTLYRLQTVPGIGTSLSLVLLSERHHSARFPSVQAFVSSCRVVTCAKAAAGKRYGTTGPTIGHASLPWAFSEAAVLFRRDNPPGPNDRARLENQQGQGKALTILAHTLARAVSDMLKRATALKMDQFIHGSRRRAGAPDASRDTKGMSLGRALCNPACLASSNAQACVGRLSLSPAPLIGHPLRLRCLRRCSQRVNVGCPSPAPEPHGRRRPLQPPLCVGRDEGTERFRGRRARSTALQSSSRRRLHLHTGGVPSHAHCTCSGK